MPARRLPTGKDYLLFHTIHNGAAVATANSREQTGSGKFETVFIADYKNYTTNESNR